jgi:hypothetical protein
MSLLELKEDDSKLHNVSLLLGNSSGYESNSENDEVETTKPVVPISTVKRKTKHKAKPDIDRPKPSGFHKEQKNDLEILSDDDTADISLLRFDERFLRPIRKFYNHDDGKPKSDANNLNEIPQLIKQIYTNVSADKVQFLNISCYEKHFLKYFLKDKYYINTFLKCLIESLSEFIKVKAF